MLAVGTWGNDEVSPADIRVGKEGIFAALIVCGGDEQPEREVL